MIILFCCQILVVIFIIIGVIKMHRNNKEIQKLIKESARLSEEIEEKLQDLLREV